VIGPSGTVRVLVATRPADFRNGAEVHWFARSWRLIRSRARSMCSVQSVRTGSSWCFGMARSLCLFTKFAGKAPSEADTQDAPHRRKTPINVPAEALNGIRRRLPNCALPTKV
jgi:hypothetical protein